MRSITALENVAAIDWRQPGLREGIMLHSASFFTLGQYELENLIDF